ncbi:MAG: hypothetical protein RLY78_2831 [Pseudomonadota bacterium]|jgi:cation/acetate symporter|uniref:VC_2705 family sodium/solute symporter n=1 Tax=Pseudaquabacterium rugosum TaxID=2984194 RepID=A0ABU9BF64_9BURK
MSRLRLRVDENTRRFTRRLHRRYLLFTLGLLLFVGCMALLERAGWPRAGIGASFLIGTVLVYAGIGLMSRTTDEAEYYVAGRRVPAIYNGMATAADWMSAASFIGTAGVLYLNGFNALAYILGWTGGFCLVAVLLAPYLRRFGQFTIPDFLGARYGGHAPRVIGVLATVLVSFVYVVVQVYGVGLVVSHLTGFSFDIGIFVGLGGVLVCSFLGGMRAVTWTQVAQYIVLILAYTAPVVWLGLHQGGGLAPMFNYQRQLQVVTAREAELMRDPAELQVRAIHAQRADEARRKLRDVPAAMAADTEQLARDIERMRAEDVPLAQIQRAERRLERLPRTVPTARAQYERELAVALQQSQPLAGLARQTQPPEPGSRLNFLGLVLCLMLGTAAMPHMLTRYYTTPSVAEARRSVGWSLLFIVGLYISAPALAVMVKYEVFTQLVGTSYGSLPDWVHRWSKLDPALVNFSDVNGDGLLQLSELRLGGDMIVLAAPEMGGLPLVVTYLVAAGGLAAALSTADGLLLTIANALAHDLVFRTVQPPRASAIRRVMLSKMMVLLIALLAAWVATLRITNILPFVTAAFSLAASAFFPALVMGIFWRGANRAGAVSGMLVGTLACLACLACMVPALRPWLPWAPWIAGAGLEPMVAGGLLGVPSGALTLALVSLARAQGASGAPEVVDLLRQPRGGARQNPL